MDLEFSGICRCWMHSTTYELIYYLNKLTIRPYSVRISKRKDDQFLEQSKNGKMLNTNNNYGNRR